MNTIANARLGREIGVLLPVRHPTQLQSFHMLTVGHNFRTVTFRLNLYAVQNGRPQNTLHRRDIIFSVNSLHRGWTEIDLHSNDIMLAGSQQVLATIEWLANEPEVTKVDFLNIPAHISATHSNFVRDKSTQNWRKLGANPNMYFLGFSYPG